MAPQAFVVKLDTIFITDHDQDITFDGETYEANDSLMRVQEITERYDSIPRVGFSVICLPTTDLYLLLNDDPGPIECSMVLVEFSVPDDEWQKRWEFKGILSSGSMRDYLYEGAVEHIISWKLRTRKPLMWDNTTQQNRHLGDLGLEYVHEIEDIRSTVTWRGSEA